MGTILMKDLIKLYNQTNYTSVYKLRKEFASWNNEALCIAGMYDISEYKGFWPYDIFTIKLKNLTKRSMIQNCINNLINKFGLVK